MRFAVLSITFFSFLLQLVTGIQRGALQPEESPSLTVSIEGEQIKARAVLDANWRWVHQPQGYDNCFTDSWRCESSACDQCVLEGVSLPQYLSTYGIDSDLGSKLTLRFVTGSNVGSRLYLVTEDGRSYLPIRPLNKRISFDMDLSQVPCGVNAAVYLVNMTSTLADLGVGYGDAQCPTDIKYLGSGEVNLARRPVCALELDLTEANRESMAWTLHPCVSGTDCDKAGADMNAYRQGFPEFYGPGKILDTRRPFTVVTEFRADSMRRFYKQDDKILEHPAGELTAHRAAAWAASFGEESRFDAAGGFSAFWAQGEYVLVISIWDDPSTNMQWLDGTIGSGPGSARGPCDATTDPRHTDPQAFYTFSALSIESI